jgi:hypothetical protein
MKITCPRMEPGRMKISCPPKYRAGPPWQRATRWAIAVTLPFGAGLGAYLSLWASDPALASKLQQMLQVRGPIAATAARHPRLDVPVCRRATLHIHMLSAPRWRCHASCVTTRLFPLPLACSGPPSPAS